MAFEPPRAKKEVWERRSVVRGVVRVGWGRVGRMNARICVLVGGVWRRVGGRHVLRKKDCMRKRRNRGMFSVLVWVMRKTLKRSKRATATSVVG